MTASASEVYCLKSEKFSRFDGFSQHSPAFITNVNSYLIQNKYPYLPYLKALDNNGLKDKTNSLTIFRLM